jgi:hypothetical protein
MLEVEVESDSVGGPAVTNAVSTSKSTSRKSPVIAHSNVGQLTKAISQVMLEIDTVAKRGENTFHRYRYAKMEDVLRRLTPLLGKHGIAVFQDEVARSMFDGDSVIAITYEFVVAHESGETWPDRLRQTGVSRCRDSKGGWDDKAVNKCHTAARKYFLLSLFQIPTGDEEDADRGGREAARTDDTKPSKDAKNWTTKFLARVRQLRSADAIAAYVKDNDALLERLADVAPEQAAIVEEAVNRRQRELNPPSKALPPLVTKGGAESNHIR